MIMHSHERLNSKQISLILDSIIESNVLVRSHVHEINIVNPFPINQRERSLAHLVAQ